MKKITSILCLLLMALVFTFSGITSISAAPSSTTIIQDGVMRSYIGTEANEFRWAKFKTSDGNIAYCMDVQKKWPGTSNTMSLNGEANAGVKYILENGYPNKKLYDGGDIDRFTTQAAIWWYLGEIGEGEVSEVLKSTGTEAYTGIRDRIKTLVNGAKSAKNNTTNTSVNVNVNNTNMALDSEKKYYVSQEIAPTVTGASTYKVTVSGAKVTATNGQEKSEFNAGEKFLVKIPANSIGKTTNVSIKISASNTIKKAYIFKPADSSFQRIVSLYTETQNAEKTITLTAKVDKETVCVDYVIVGGVKPAAELTDPTPEKVCYDKGTKYTEEDKLTTRQENCKFNGWYTKEDLTGKWTNGTALNKDLTLYGAWDCGTVINVPPTAANTSLMILGGGLVAIAAGVGVYVYRDRKLKANK